MRSDAVTVQAVLAGQREVFAELVRRYEGVVHAVALEVLRDHHAAQDVCQETFVAAYRRLATLREPSSFGPWIVRIARNQAMSLVQRKRPEQPLDDSEEIPLHRRDGQLDDRARQLLNAVTELPEHERTVVMLRYFAGHSMQQLSAMTGLPVGTIASQLHRARTRLRERLEGVEP